MTDARLLHLKPALYTTRWEQSLAVTKQNYT